MKTLEQITAEINDITACIASLRSKRSGLLWQQTKRAFSDAGIRDGDTVYGKGDEPYTVVLENCSVHSDTRQIMVTVQGRRAGKHKVEMVAFLPIKDLGGLLLPQILGGRR